jgi:tRNA threonylcarbamoyladenosine modification (KEOPS) complex  Pcc1 subunit
VDIIAEPRTIRAVKAAMTPEIDNSKRCKLSLRTDKRGRTLSLILTSEDLVSLRAGLNTNLRLASSALKSIIAAKNVEATTRSQKD